MSKGTSSSAAEEIVQETMIKVWRKAEQFDPSRASASTWIFTIARNTRIDVLRKIIRPEPDVNDPAFEPSAEPLPSDLLGRSQEAAAIREAIAELSVEQQDVLRLGYFEERPHPEIAKALKIPLGTVKSRIRLALKNIRSNFGESL